MPIFAGLITSTLSWFVVWLGARITAKLALVAGVVAVSVAGYLATKAAIFAIVTALGFVVPPAILTAVGYALPQNLPACIGAIFLSDAIFEAYSFWREKFALVSLALFNS